MAVATGSDYGSFIDGAVAEPASGQMRDVVEPDGLDGSVIAATLVARLGRCG